MAKIGVLGLGTVGKGLVELIDRNRDLISSRSDVELSIKSAYVRDNGKPRPLSKEKLTHDPETIFSDPEISIVVEVIGGIEPAKSLILRALEAGKNVVTANKAVLARHGDEIFEAANKSGKRVGFEASVCGGIPILRALSSGLIANRVDELIGILNGTSNFILSKMTDEGLTYNEALLEAQNQGLAESDPSFDVGGIDAAHKLLILAELTFQTKATLEDISIRGIENIDSVDVRSAKEFGFQIKPLAIANQKGSRLELRVHPALVASSSPLAAVNQEFNAVLVRGDAIGEMIFYGKGAGSLPTASAVLSDIVEIARSSAAPLIWNPLRSVKIAPISTNSRYYLRFPIFDRPGLIGKIATILGEHGVSITHASARLDCDETQGGNVMIITHHANAEELNFALNEIRSQNVLRSKSVSIRILD